MGWLIRLLESLWKHFHPPDTLLPEPCQAFTMEVKIDQREVRAQPVLVLWDASIAGLVEAEDTLQHAEHVLYLCPDARLDRVFFFCTSSS